MSSCDTMDQRRARLCGTQVYTQAELTEAWNIFTSLPRAFNINSPNRSFVPREDAFEYYADIRDGLPRSWLDDWIEENEAFWAKAVTQ